MITIHCEIDDGTAEEGEAYVQEFIVFDADAESLRNIVTTLIMTYPGAKTIYLEIAEDKGV